MPLATTRAATISAVGPPRLALYGSADAASCVPQPFHEVRARHVQGLRHRLHRKPSLSGDVASNVSFCPSARQRMGSPVAGSRSVRVRWFCQETAATSLRGPRQRSRYVRGLLGDLVASRQPALSRELGRRAEALSFWQLSRSSGRGIPIGHGLRPEGAQGAAGNQMALDVEGVVGGGLH